MYGKGYDLGNPTKMILNFTIPLFIGNVFQQLYNMADTIIVGKFVGANALAAVGSTGTIMFLIIGFSARDDCPDLQCLLHRNSEPEI